MPPANVLISSAIGTKQPLSAIEKAGTAYSFPSAQCAVILYSRLKRPLCMPLRISKPRKAYCPRSVLLSSTSIQQTAMLGIEQSQAADRLISAQCVIINRARLMKEAYLSLRKYQPHKKNLPAWCAVVIHFRLKRQLCFTSRIEHSLTHCGNTICSRLKIRPCLPLRNHKLHTACSLRSVLLLSTPDPKDAYACHLEMVGDMLASQI